MKTVWDKLSDVAKCEHCTLIILKRCGVTMYMKNLTTLVDKMVKNHAQKTSIYYPT